MRAWLSCVAFLYPFYWLSQFALYAAPALVQTALGARLEHFEASAMRVRATPSGGADGVPVAALAGALAGAAWLVSRKHPTLGGLAMAAVAQAALEPSLVRLWVRRQPSAELLFAVVLAVGLSRMTVGASYARRLAWLLAGFSAPLGALWILSGLRFRTPSLLAAVMAPGVIAALLVSLRSARGGAQTGWKAAVAGAVLSLLIVSGARSSDSAWRQSRLSAARAAMAAVPEIPADLPYPRLFFQKGVNFTAEFPGGYNSESARRMLEQLPEYGVDAVALVPYGFARRDPPGVTIGRGQGFLESDEGIEHLSRLAHHRGMRVLLKPQVWLGRRGPGSLEFRSAAERQAWFAGYRAFVEHYARLARRIHADLFAVGVEFGKLTPYQQEWRRLIARARELYPGPLVYAANAGEEFEKIEFWDALDYIGLNNYYPLPDDLGADEVVRKVEAVQRRFGKPVVFTEAGFSSYEAPHRRPWDDTARQLAPQDQARCYEAVFRAFYRQPWFHGVYWWKVGTNGAGGPEDGSHTPWRKPAMEVMARWYRTSPVLR